MTVDSIGTDFAPAPRPTVASAELDGEAVLYDEASGSIHVLNPTATIVWKCFDGHATLAELVSDLSDAFEADLEAVRHDVVALTRQLGEQGLLEGVAAAETATAPLTVPDQPPQPTADDDCD